MNTTGTHIFQSAGNALYKLAIPKYGKRFFHADQIGAFLPAAYHGNALTIFDVPQNAIESLAHGRCRDGLFVHDAVSLFDTGPPCSLLHLRAIDSTTKPHGSKPSSMQGEL